MTESHQVPCLHNLARGEILTWTRYESGAVVIECAKCTQELARIAYLNPGQLPKELRHGTDAGKQRGVKV